MPLGYHGSIMVKLDYDIAIVGGGASGLAAAIAAAQEARNAHRLLSVGVLEERDRVGKTILATGNGRCNFTNEHILWGEYRNGAFVKEVLESLGDDDVVLDFFEGWGLEWRQEAEGRRYPQANKASVVVDVLRAAAAELGVAEACNVKVAQVRAPQGEGGHFTLHLADGALMRARRVVVACGGLAAGTLQVEGLKPEPPVPVLGPIRCSEESCRFTRELDNVRVRCSVGLFRPQDATTSNLVASRTGELLFRPYGVSGICVFDLSRFAEPGDALSIDFMTMSDLDRARDYLARRWDDLHARFGERLDVACMLRGLVLPRVAEALCKRQGVDLHGVCGKDDLGQLVDMLCRCTLDVDGIADAAQCQVQRGGYRVDEVSAHTLEAHQVPGLHLVGEALDVDGPCGGYNLHWAWGSGLLAGGAAARALLAEG